MLKDALAESAMPIVINILRLIHGLNPYNILKISYDNDASVFLDC